MLIARQWAPYWDTRNVQAILTWDALGYYLYLPAHFIYDDLRTMAFMPKIMAEYQPSAGFYQAFQVPGAPAGHLVTKYPIGLALLELPFFGIGHWLAKTLGYAADGFSAPYQMSIAYGAIAYATAGLALLRRVLLRYFSDLLTLLTLVLVALGTNYFQYAVYDGAMAHSTCFTLYALLLWCTIRWHETPRFRWAAGIGLVLGLLVNTRPSELVAVLLPVLWGIGSVADVQAKATLAGRHWQHLVVAAVVGLAAVSPQLLYWKWATGHFFFYSYEEQGFSFLRPHLGKVLFSFRKGWLIYTPLMILALLGLVALWQRNRRLAVPVIAFALVNIWIVSAWDIWWYGGSFGQRAMVQSYAVLSLPLGALLAEWLRPGPAAIVPSWRALSAAPVLTFLVMLNLFQTWQYMYSIITTEDMNRSYWRAIFLNAQPTQADYARLDVETARPGPASAWELREVGKQTFDGLPPEQGGEASVGLYQSTAFALGSDHPSTSWLVMRVADLQAQPHDWLRVGASVWSEWGAWGSKLVMEIRRGDQQLAWHGVRLHNNLTVNRRWNQVYFDVPLPPDIQPTDEVRIYGWAPAGASACRLDDLTLAVATRRR